MLPNARGRTYPLVLYRQDTVIIPDKSSDTHAASRWGRLYGIQKEIIESVAHLLRIEACGFDLDLLLQPDASHMSEFHVGRKTDVQERIEHDSLLMRLIALGHAQQSPQKPIQPLDLTQDHRQDFLGSCATTGKGVLGLQAHCRDRVTDLMGDACNHATDGGQALAGGDLPRQFRGALSRYRQTRAGVI